MSETDQANTNALRERIAQFKYWYHRIELPGGVITPGWAPIDPKIYRVPDDLTGKRVLDIGAWDGYWTFEALRRGAREVVAIDDFSDFLGHLKPDDRDTRWGTFDFCRAALGYDSKRCERIEMNVYDISEERLGRFDIVFFFGTLYHLRHPLLALDRISAVCDHQVFVESHICDDFSPYRGVGKGYKGQMVMEFYPTNQLGNNATNWWGPSLLCMAHMINVAGFDEATAWPLTETPSETAHCRGFAMGTKLPGTSAESI